jgi:hypothetical protein
MPIGGRHRRHRVTNVTHRLLKINRWCVWPPLDHGTLAFS